MDNLQTKLKEMEERNPSVSLRNNPKSTLKERVNFFFRDKLRKVSSVEHNYFRISYIEGWGYLMSGQNDYQEFHPEKLVGYKIGTEDVGKFCSFMDKYGIEPIFGKIIDRQELWMDKLRDMHNQLGIFETKEELRESTKKMEGKKAIEVFVKNFDSRALWDYNTSCRNGNGRGIKWKFGYCERIHNPKQGLKELRNGKKEPDFTIDTSGYDGWLNPNELI